MSQPNCYECKHRRGLVGSAHSSCQHPKTGNAHGDPLNEVMAIFASVGRVPPRQAATALHVTGHPTGKRRGWFNWPWNYDPHWLLTCDGFEPKEKREEPA